MSPQPYRVLQVQAEVQVPVATVQIVHIDQIDPTDLVMDDRDAYWLELSLSHRPLSARACYLDHWNAHRFERLGRMYLLPPGESIQARCDGGSSLASLLCKLQPDSVHRWLGGNRRDLWSGRRLEASLDIADTGVRNLLLKLANELRHPGLGSEALVESIVNQISIELGRYFVRFDAIPNSAELANWRLRLIDDRLAELQEPPTLTELAALCELSVRQLTRGFRASRGCSIGDYIAAQRIERAKQCLASHRALKEIAYSLGYPSPSGFSFAFRRATGMTPGEFRAITYQRVSH